jgi:AI-2 transport protein TqsA
MTTTFVALVFWAWLLGPLGALLAGPLALLLKAVLVDVDPTARWATALAGTLASGPRSDRGPPDGTDAPVADVPMAAPPVAAAPGVPAA